ncbi:hypothetical protein FB451DRAFT_532408 [Mycena latifolia]|nr:hypothetical protein FB451DRAFT_532408 [Mycena latifolia]
MHPMFPPCQPTLWQKIFCLLQRQMRTLDTFHHLLTESLRIHLLFYPLHLSSNSSRRRNSDHPHQFLFRRHSEHLPVKFAALLTNIPGNRISFSSPLRPAQSSTSLAQTKYPPGKSFEPSQMHGNSAFYQHPRNIIHEARLIPVRQSPAGSNVPLAQEPCHMLTPSSSTPHPHTLPAAKPSPALHQLVPPSHPKTPLAGISLCHWDDPSARAPSADAHSQSKDVCHHRDLTLHPKLPPSSPILSPNATPSPSTRRKREPARKRISPTTSARAPKRQKSDAYDYLHPDPDDEWSTLPARKKFKAPEQIKPRINGVRTTAPFRLPGTSTKTKVTGISATSERRVVTFLPPPLKAKNVEVLVEDAQPKNSSQSPLLDFNGTPPRAPKHSRGSSESSPPMATPKRRRVSENPYPSPANSRLTPGNATTIDPASAASFNSPSSPAAPIRPSTHHRIPSPPTSDPLPEYDSDVHTMVTVG